MQGIVAVVVGSGRGGQDGQSGQAVYDRERVVAQNVVDFYVSGILAVACQWTA